MIVYIFGVMNQLRGDHTAHAPSLPASQQNLEDTDETCADSRYHSDHGSGSQVPDLILVASCVSIDA